MRKITLISMLVLIISLFFSSCQDLSFVGEIYLIEENSNFVRKTYEYNERGLLIKTTMDYGDVVNFTEFSYDTDKRLISMHNGADLTAEYEYLEDSIIVKSYSRQELYQLELVELNSKGKCSKWVVHSVDGNGNFGEIKYGLEYFWKNGNVIETNDYFINNNIDYGMVHKTTFKYDNKKNPNKKRPFSVWFGSENNLESSVIENGIHISEENFNYIYNQYNLPETQFVSNEEGEVYDTIHFVYNVVVNE